MKPTIFDDGVRRRLIARLDNLRLDSPRRWGTMTANQMICHLQDSIRCAIGEVKAERMRTPFSNRLLRYLIIHVIPWPKGRAKTAKEMLQTLPGDFDADRQRLREYIEAAGQRGPNASWIPHPAFGNMSGRDYGVLIWRHCDYHFRQFGV